MFCSMLMREGKLGLEDHAKYSKRFELQEHALVLLKLILQEIIYKIGRKCNDNKNQQHHHSVGELGNIIHNHISNRLKYLKGKLSDTED